MQRTRLGTGTFGFSQCWTGMLLTGWLSNTRVLLRFHGNNRTAKAPSIRQSQRGELVAEPYTEDADHMCIWCHVVSRAVMCHVLLWKMSSAAVSLLEHLTRHCVTQLSKNLHQRRHTSYCVSSQSVDSSLGGLSRSSTVASLDTDSTKSSGKRAG